jgi:hypothetical protein
LAVIIYTSIRIHLSIKGTAGVVRNAKAMKIHKQVTKILIIQVSILGYLLSGLGVSGTFANISQISGRTSDNYNCWPWCCNSSLHYPSNQCSFDWSLLCSSNCLVFFRQTNCDHFNYWEIQETNPVMVMRNV